MTAILHRPEPVALDFNESPLGPSPLAVQRLAAGARDLHRYPRGLHERMCARVAAHFGVPEQRVVLTRGVDEAADLMLGLASEAWCLRPGFDGYPIRAEERGVPVRELPLDPLTWLPAADPPEAPDLVLLAQPNNPTGNLLPRPWVRRLLHRARLSLVDETYLDFTTTSSYTELMDDVPGLCVFKSFSKSYGLAGLRVGAVIASDDLAGRLRAAQRFYPVDVLALHALGGALDDDGYRRRVAAHVRDGRRAYAAALRTCPAVAEVAEAQTNFVLARCAPGFPSAVVVAGLAEQGVLVRDCGPLDMPGWLRIGIGSARDLDRLVGCLTAVGHRSQVEVCGSPNDGGQPRPPRLASETGQVIVHVQQGARS